MPVPSSGNGQLTEYQSVWRAISYCAPLSYPYVRIGYLYEDSCESHQSSDCV